MRLMITFSFPTESGNEIVASGKIKQIFDTLMADLKPEAAYFYPEGGDRGGVIFVNANDGDDFIRSGESFWLALNAKIEVKAVVNADELGHALAQIPAIAAKYR